MKIYLIPILFLLLLNPVLAITVSCGKPQGSGNYIFYNRDYVPVRVFINTGGTSISVSPNNFDIPVGSSQLVEFRASTNTYAQLSVTYTDTVSNISASLQCYFYATTGDSSTTTTTVDNSISTTTTIQQQGSCSSYTDASSCRAAGCIWQSFGISGYCIDVSSSTTTSQTATTTTTQSQFTTTTQSQTSCSGRSFSTCNLIPGCEWVGSMTSGYCRSISTTSILTSTTTSTTPTTTTLNTGSSSTESSSSTGGSSSGASSSSTGGSSSGASSGKSTGFYDFPSFIQLPINGEKIIKGTFYAAKDLSDVKFQVADINADWFTITPSSVSTIKKGEAINLTLTIKVPENAKQDSYIFKLVAKTNVNYEKSLTLAVTEKSSTTVTTFVTTTIEQKQPSTGLFAEASKLAINYWYLVLIPVALIITISVLPLMSHKKSKGSAYIVADSEQDYKEDFVEVKIKEPETQQEIQLEKPKRDANDAIRKKVIKEIRERVMKDKKH